jgi:hypothetical protein
VRSQGAQVCAYVSAADKIRDDIKAAGGRPLRSILRSGRAWNQKSRFESKLLCSLYFLGGSRGSKRHRIHGPRQLERRHPDTATYRMNQYAFIRAKGRLNPQSVMGRDKGLWDGGGFFPAQISRNLHQSTFMRDQILGLCSASDKAHYALSWLPELDGVSDTLDFAGKLHSWNFGRNSRRGWVLSASLQQVGTV